ncbi:MAG: DUF1738 domain-containing protein [Hyphomicrobiaceae bacterium]|nr:DUF1738 domain-containing protein [Hyphomicrobiaceae bacterium]
MTVSVVFELPTPKSGFLDDLVADIVTRIDAGVPPVRPLWFDEPGLTEPPTSIATGRPFQGTLAPFLSETARDMKWTSKFWGTVADWQARGCSLPSVATAIDLNDDRLLSADQVVGCEGAKSCEIIKPFDGWATPMYQLAKRAHIRIALADIGPNYMPKFDVIRLPSPEYVFGCEDTTPVEAFQIAGFHEMIHWTGGKSRLRRFKVWSRRGVAVEEIAAELGAAYLCRNLGVSAKVSPRHVAYIDRYWRQLDNDPGAMSAATEIAEAAIRLIYEEAQHHHEARYR